MLERTVRGSITYRSFEALTPGILDPDPAALDSMILCLRSTKTSVSMSQASSTVRGEGGRCCAGRGCRWINHVLHTRPLPNRDSRSHARGLGFCDPVPAWHTNVSIVVSQVSSTMGGRMLGLVQEYHHHHIPHPRILLHRGLHETLNSALPVLGATIMVSMSLMNNICLTDDERERGERMEDGVLAAC